MSQFLRVSKNKIIDGNGKAVQLKGVNLGGWLMMEGYFTYAPNRAVQLFKKDFEDRLGREALLEFEKEYYRNFIQENDVANVAKMGANCFRLPFNCRLIEKEPYQYDEDGLSYLDRAIEWAKKDDLKVILDLHAAPGAQNHDWHGDSLGAAELWTEEENQQRVFALWKFLADRYKDNETVAGYDLLNESVIDDNEILNKFYAQLIREIRSVDQNHIIFVEGNKWATDLRCLDEFDDDNWAYSIHFYHPIDFTFNFVPGLSYPSLRFDERTLKNTVASYQRFADNHPVLVGEFGINSRNGLYGEDKLLSDTLECFDEAGFHWTYWTYKAVKHHMFPDGIYSYVPNDPWVHRHGPKSGWETWADLWPTHKEQIIESWRTENFTVNESVMKVLKEHL